MENQSRRAFLATGTKLAGVAAASTGIVAATSAPQRPVEMRDSQCGATGGTRVLVVYASKLGSTVGIAEAISAEICSNDTIVDTKWVGHVESVEGYDAVIVGSAIRYDKWLPEAVEFVNTHKGALAQMPVAFFLVCLNVTRDTEKSRGQVAGYVQTLEESFPTITPTSIARLAGALDYATMPWWARPIARGMFAILGVPEGDYRDWAAITTWAAQAKRELLPA